jgi:hypothetical protein
MLVQNLQLPLLAVFHLKNDQLEGTSCRTRLDGYNCKYATYFCGGDCLTTYELMLASQRYISF